MLSLKAHNWKLFQFQWELLKFVHMINNKRIQVSCKQLFFFSFFFINMLKQKKQFNMSNVTPKGRAGDKVIYGGSVWNGAKLHSNHTKWIKIIHAQLARPTAFQVNTQAAKVSLKVWQNETDLNKLMTCIKQS